MKRTFLAGVLLTFCGVTQAAYVEPDVQAALDGFKGCGGAIREAMKSYIRSPDGRYFTKWSDETIVNSYFFGAAFGQAGDTIYQDTAVVKAGNICVVTTSTVLTVNQRCIQYKEENPAWTYEATLGDYTFTKNKGGVRALLKDFNSGCVVQFNMAQKYPADK